MDKLDILIEWCLFQENIGAKIAGLLRKMPNDPMVKSLAAKYVNLTRAMQAKGPSLVKPETLKAQMGNLETQVNTMMTKVGV